jgi:hypothetical protein
MVWEDCSQGTTPRPFETKQVRALWAFFGFDVQEFDRWLASVKADVWDECAQEAYALGWLHESSLFDLENRNTYRGVDDE